MKISKSNFTNLYNNISNTIKNSYNTNVKPRIQKGMKRVGELTADTVDFISKNPKKVVKYTAFAALGASVIALGIKAVKDFVETKKQNKILKDFVVAERETINDLKGLIAMQHEAMAAKDAISAAQSKVIAKQEA